MFQFEADIQDAANQGHLSEASRFAVQRFAELVGRGTHFSLSAAFVLTPHEVAGELAALATDYGAGRTFPKRQDMGRACQWAKKALVSDPNLRRWYGTALNDALHALSSFNHSYSRSVPGGQLRALARTQLEPTLAALRAAVATGAMSYQRQLLASVTAEFVAATPDWLRLDRDLRYLAACILADGRDGETTARKLATAAVRAPDDAAVVAAWRSIIPPSLVQYEVGHVISGLGEFASPLTPPARTYGPGDDWLVGPGDAGAIRALEGFCRRATRDRRRVVVLRPVSAYDEVHAARVAFAETQLIHDELVALHRATMFAIEPASLVRSSVGTTEVDLRERHSVDRGRLFRPGVAAKLRSPLRYHALARSEEIPTMRIVDAYTALEQIAEGASSASGPIHKADFLPPQVAGAAALTAAQHVLVASWAVIVESLNHSAPRNRFLELAAWCGGTGDPRWIDLDRWADVLLAEPAGAAPTPLLPTTHADAARAILDELSVFVTPYVWRHVLRASLLWSNPALLIETATLEQRRAFAHTDRVRLVRNQVMHRAPLAVDGDLQLATNALHLVDATVEVLARWLAASPGLETWEALRDALHWQRSHRTAWRHGSGPRAATLVCP
jgi:hypothetical protein